jgi:hypothetical protein
MPSRGAHAMRRAGLPLEGAARGVLSPKAEEARMRGELGIGRWVLACSAGELLGFGIAGVIARERASCGS